MRRSRSSFDLSDALIAAESLSPKPTVANERPTDFGGVPLVAFDRASEIAVREEVSRSEPPSRLAAPPHTSGSVSARCNMLLEWLRSDPHTTSVLLVDGEGLAVAEESSRDEALLGATAGVAHAIRQLALASPGILSRDFESHVGDGPIVSLIGFIVNTKLYIVGVSHNLPLSEHDTEEIRAAFANALAPLTASLASAPPPPSSKNPRNLGGGRG